MGTNTTPITRRQFIGSSTGSALLLLAGGCSWSRSSTPALRNGEFLFLEAEGFADYDGWELDQQSMDQMGSPYLLAHGLGIPVRDAGTKVRFPSAGIYRI